MCYFNFSTNLTVRILDLVRAISSVVPEVITPADKVSVDEKVVYTMASGLLFMLGQVPIFGLVKDAPLRMEDPFFSLRPLFAMEQGTLLELGLLPLITAAFLWQLSAGTRSLKVNFRYSADRELFQSAQKITSILLGAAFAAALLFSGYYDYVVRGGAGETSSYGAYLLIFTQIVGWNIVVTLMAEVLDKGYGFGSGIMCLLGLNAAAGLVRDVVGVELVAVSPEGEPQTYGVATYLIRSLLSMELSTIRNALVGIFTRSGFPSIGMVLLVLATGLGVVFLQNFRQELPIRSNRARGTANVYPLRLLYTGALPVVFAFATIANVQILLHFIAAALQPIYPFASHLLESSDASGHVVSGVAFYFSAPSSFSASLWSPIRAVVYSGSIIVLSAVFAAFWAGISGSSPKDIARQFKEQSIVISGCRDVSVTKTLSRKVPVAAVSGAVALTGLALVGELVGASGKTVSVAVGVASAFGVLEDFMAELQQNGGGSMMSSLTGLR